MQYYRGNLEIVDATSESFLVNSYRRYLLLMDGDYTPDERRSAATDFLINIRRLQRGESIKVKGRQGQSGTVYMILMSDAWEYSGVLLGKKGLTKNLSTGGAQNGLTKQGRKGKKRK